jgi:hypothetical protein
MKSATDQELSPAAAHRILRSIAYWDWTRLDQAAGLGHGLPVTVDAPAQPEIFDDIEELDAEPISSPAFQLLKRAGGWYLNEVPEELLEACEKELLMSDPRIDLTEARGVSKDGGAADTADAVRVAARVPNIGQSGGLVTPTGWFQLSDPT